MKGTPKQERVAFSCFSVTENFFLHEFYPLQLRSKLLFKLLTILSLTWLKWKRLQESGKKLNFEASSFFS